MKLNLLPKIVDTTGRAKRAFFAGILVFAGSCVAAFMMVNISNARLQKANDSVTEATPMYDAAVKVAADADAIMARPEVRQLVVNTALAKEMIASNRRYPDLYDSVKPYIPRFFRITSLSASPIDAASCTVSMTGTVKSAQEYADLMLALLRIPGATSVSRAGFQKEDVIVPPLVLVDNQGRPRLESKGPIPDDPLDRLAYFENDTSASGYFSAGNFGNLEYGTEKGARPGESQITVSVTIPQNIQTPNPRATIQSLAGGNAPANTPQARPAANTPPAVAPPADDPGTPKGKAAAGDD